MKFKTVKVSICLAKRLKKSLLSQSNILFVELHAFFSLFPFLLSFLYFSKKNWTSSVPNTAEDFLRVIFQNDWDSSESGRKLLDKLNKITIPFLEPFLLPSG